MIPSLTFCLFKIVTSPLILLQLKITLTVVAQAPAMIQILPFLVCWPRDTVLEPVSNFLGDRVLNRSMYAQIHFYRTKTRQFGNSQYALLLHYIVSVPRQTCSLFQKPCFVQCTHPIFIS